MPPHVAVFVQALALLSAGALAIPVYSGVEDDDASWNDVFGRAADEDYEYVQQLAVGPECAFGDYGVGIVGEDLEVLDVDVLAEDPDTQEVYDDEEEEEGAAAADMFQLGDDASYADVYAKLVAWLLQVDREQLREEAEKMATSFLDDLKA